MSEQEAEEIAAQIARKVELRCREAIDFPRMMQRPALAAIYIDLRDEIKQLILVPPR